MEREEDEVRRTLSSMYARVEIPHSVSSLIARRGHCREWREWGKGEIPWECHWGCCGGQIGNYHRIFGCGGW